MNVNFDQLINFLFPRWNWLYSKSELINAIVNHGLNGFGYNIKYIGGGLYNIKNI